MKIFSNGKNSFRARSPLGKHRFAIIYDKIVYFYETAKKHYDEII